MLSTKLCELHFIKTLKYCRLIYLDTSNSSLVVGQLAAQSHDILRMIRGLCTHRVEREPIWRRYDVLELVGRVV